MAANISPIAFYQAVKTNQASVIKEALDNGLTIDHILLQTPNDEKKWAGQAARLSVHNLSSELYVQYLESEDALIRDVFAVLETSLKMSKKNEHYKMNEEAYRLYINHGIENELKSAKKGNFIMKTTGLFLFLDRFLPDYKRIKAFETKSLVSSYMPPVYQENPLAFDEVKLIWDVEETKLANVQKTIAGGMKFEHYAAVDGDGNGILDIAEQTALSLPIGSEKRQNAQEIVALLRSGKKEAIKTEVLPVLKTALLSLEREDADPQYTMSIGARRKLHDFIKIYRTSLVNEPDKSAIGVLHSAIAALSKDAYAPKENIAQWLVSNERKTEMATRIEPYTLNKLKDFIAVFAEEATQINRIAQTRLAVQSNGVNAYPIKRHGAGQNNQMKYNPAVNEGR